MVDFAAFQFARLAALIPPFTYFILGVVKLRTTLRYSQIRVRTLKSFKLQRHAKPREFYIFFFGTDRKRYANQDSSAVKCARIDASPVHLLYVPPLHQ